MNKKALAEIVSYVLLLMIAVSISTLVFFFLKSYIPKYELPTCPDDVSIIIQSAECKLADEELLLGISNRGLFTIKGIQVKLNPENKKIQNLVVYKEEERYYPIEKFTPGTTIETYQVNLDTANIGDNEENFSLTITPIYYDEEKEDIAICEHAAITQTITCN